MREQNIYDNPVFFEGYRKLRENPASANELVEKPALFSLCPDFTGKRVLDLGCGYGENCKRFSELGASSVVGIDISEKMLAVAQTENAGENIRYCRLSINYLNVITEKFDVVTSSLAVHYIEDFDALVANVYALLNDGGIFIFSQEHPITTALKTDDRWCKDENGNKLHYKLTDYSLPGERKTSWFVDEVVKYHRTFSSILNSLCDAGFVIEKVLEPMPTEEVMEEYPAYQRYLLKPDFLLIRARKR